MKAERWRNIFPGFSPGFPRIRLHVLAVFCSAPILNNRQFLAVFIGFLVVLPGGIEPPASPLPRECSTPELRQLMRVSNVSSENVAKLP